MKINLCCAFVRLSVPSRQGQTPASTGYRLYSSIWATTAELWLLQTQLPPTTKTRWGPCRGLRPAGPGLGAAPLEDALGPGTSPAQGAAWARASRMSPELDLGTGSTGSPPGLPAKLCLCCLLPGSRLLPLSRALG